MKTIKRVHTANYNPISDLITYTPLPSQSLFQIDPFLLLNHHGPQYYSAPNRGLPFGPHPHRGMETITFVFDGDIMHRDSAGNESVIYPDGVQYMSAGKGLIHAEQSSSGFKENGGQLEILQMWLNMRAADKMNAPFYYNYQKEEIPIVHENGAKIQVLAGDWKGTKGVFETKSDVQMATLHLQENARLLANVAKTRNVFFYVVRGEIKVNGTTAKKLNLVEFNNDSEEILIEAKSSSILIFGHAEPFHESVVSRGPFVMNTEKEISQAYEDYHNGIFGEWNF